MTTHHYTNTVLPGGGWMCTTLIEEADGSVKEGWSEPVVGWVGEQFELWPGNPERGLTKAVFNPLRSCELYADEIDDDEEAVTWHPDSIGVGIVNSHESAVKYLVANLADYLRRREATKRAQAKLEAK